ncbi:LicD family protein [Xylanimonas cellulosilytica DSM 15894]|uniref:LicD family protein n=1 Tax=Xylanimonas cellulosilytica (strain DSM 15894 / JCM 12276 / CECT 5975 / KCTC 9989 / LMG 20990 / NBRC 107835 / XIL07) TaxID=446471 RepID=D1BX35_XYLCX|nr:LicD family protein [Xylanimonas cellulosilytica]ACZ31603.1 LicD family protein [Xylanimonas cellulosilytica DSM 15894]
MRKEPVTPAELRELQLAMLEFVDGVCRSEGIEYTLAGGSLLGAVRHGGYIPWDDDIDVELTRPHYERLMARLRTELPEHVALLHYSERPTFLPWAKLYDTRTGYTSHIDTQHLGTGVYIDIFPMDVVPDDDAELAEHRAGFYRRFSWLAASATHGLAYASASRWRYFLGKLVLWLPRHLRYRGQGRELAATLDTYLRRYEHSAHGQIGFFHRAFPDAIYPRAMWDSYEDVPFEHLTARKLVDHDGYLTRHYGDYMTPPPAREQQEAHGFYRWFWKPGMRPRVSD